MVRVMVMWGRPILVRVAFSYSVPLVLTLLSSFLQKEIVMEAPPIGGNDFSLNKLNHGAPCGSGPFPVPGFAVMGGDEPSPSSSRPGLDPVGSLSDSLYESFSSCTSQGSNDV